MVGPGSRKEFHVEALHLPGTDGDRIRFDYSTDGGTTWTRIRRLIPPAVGDDEDADHVAPLPPSLSGSVLFRVVDTVRTPGSQSIDVIALDEVFVRSW